MTLARKGVLDYVLAKPEPSQQSNEWKANDLKALAIIVKLLSPTFQTMVREAQSAFDAWEILRAFFAKQNLHNRVQLRKQLNEFQLEQGGNLMEHLLRFDELYIKLAAAGEAFGDDEKLVILLGSLPQEYDMMIRIIEATNGVTLLAAKEMLRREYETLQKRETKETAFKAAPRSRQGFPRGGNRRAARPTGGKNGGQNGGGQFKGRCYNCKQQGHKKDDCPRLKMKTGDEFVFSATTALREDDRATWLLDSGASSHMTGDFGDFMEYADLSAPLSVTVANGQRLEVKGRGSVRFLLDSGSTVKLSNVLYVPRLDSKLVSVPALTARGVVVQFEHRRALITVNESVVATIPKVGKLFSWRVGRESTNVVNSAVATTSPSTARALWHARLGHVSDAKMRLATRACEGVPRFGDHDHEGSGICSGCALGKMTTSPFAHTSGSEVKSGKPFDLVHSDVMGPIKPVSKGGAKFVVIFVDDFSRMVFVIPIKAKSEVFERFKAFTTMVATQYGAKVRCIRSDNGGEYTSKRFNQFCASTGIIHQTSAPYSPQQNGLAERMNRSLGEGTRALLHYMNVNRVWWAEAMLTVAHTINRIPNSAHPDASPFEILHGEKPVLDYLRVFGSQGFYRVDDSKRTKLDAKAHRCMFLGYSETSKAYRVWDHEEHRIVTTRSLVLDERQPDSYRTIVYANGTNNGEFSVTDDRDDHPPAASHQRQPTGLTGPEEIEVDEGGSSEAAAGDGDVDMEDGVAADSLGECSSVIPLEGGNEIHRTLAFDRHGSSGPTLDPSPYDSLQPPPMLSLENANRSVSSLVPVTSSRSDQLVFNGGSGRPRSIAYDQQRLLTDSDDYVPRNDGPPLLTALPDATSDDDATETERQNKRPRLDEYEIALAATEVPQTNAEAMASPDAPKWKEAIRSELRSHIRNHTWDIRVRPRGMKVIGSKWVFSRKYDENGNVIRHKARLVAQGFLQTHGVDYFHTYSPVASINSIRVFLALCCSKGLKIRQFNVETAFLNGDLEEKVYMTPSAGIRVDDGMVCEL